MEGALRDDDVVRAELLDVVDLVRGRRERSDVRAERLREENRVVALGRGRVSTGVRKKEADGTRLTRPPMPTTPTFLPGPAPLRTSGEKTVRPAQSMLAACSDLSASGIGNT
jgi:hypothetical protein